MTRTAPTSSRRAIRTLTWFSAVWVVLCIAAGIGVGMQVAQLRSSADALEDAGQALSSTGSALDNLSKLPLVGKDAGRAADAVDAGGSRAQAAAEDARTSIMRTAVLISLALALLPTIPLLMVRRTLAAVCDDRA